MERHDDDSGRRGVSWRSVVRTVVAVGIVRLAFRVGLIAFVAILLLVASWYARN